METALAVSQQVIVMVLIAACGVVLKKAGKITDDLKIEAGDLLILFGKMEVLQKLAEI